MRAECPHHEDGVMHEVSRFERRAGRWVYVEPVLGGDEP